MLLLAFAAGQKIGVARPTFPAALAPSERLIPKSSAGFDWMLCLRIETAERKSDA